jgi:chorismate mutase
MMACRRQEEEERRAQYVKKLARAKAAEDNQARDPANFANRRF